MSGWTPQTTGRDGDRDTGPIAGLRAERTPEQLLALLEGQSRVLEMIAEPAPLATILEELMRVMEQQADGMLCSVLLLSADGRHVRHGAAPNLPERYNRAIEGGEIGPRAGSCGTAVFLRRQVIVTDIEHDPLWVDWKGVALDAGLRACWSTPIFSRSGDVLGTFAMYYREPKGPSPVHFSLIALATHLARIAIERDVAERAGETLVAALRKASSDLEAANQLKDQFIAMLAHELRNPLGAISNALHVVRLRIARGEAVEGPLVVAERQIGNSSRLLDDLLDVARLSRGMIQLRRESTPLRAAIAAAVEGQRHLIESRGHRLDLSLPDEPMIVDADPTRLEQMLTNLLNNATKYTPDGGEIVVDVKRQGPNAVVRVRDNGLGISPDMLPHVFDLFVQADRSLARTHGGLGLGLALVRSLVAMHGGTVEARSEGLGRGSEFILRLPLAPAAHEPAGPVEEKPGPAGASVSRRILIVEDNTDTATLLAEALTSMGHRVAVAHDGPSAISTARGVQPEIALIDIGLPGMNGYEVARRLRAEAREAKPVLVALTGYGQEEDRLRSRDSGMAAHLTKPVDIPALERIIQALAAGSPFPAEPPPASPAAG